MSQVLVDSHAAAASALVLLAQSFPSDKGVMDILVFKGRVELQVGVFSSPILPHPSFPWSAA